MVLKLQHGQARGNHIAKTLAALRREFIHRCAHEDLPARQQDLQLGELISRPTLQRRIVDGDFLQAQHIQPTRTLPHLQCMAHDALHTDNAIHAAAPLRIPGQDIHSFYFD